MSLVSVFNEWDPLEEIIVGTAINAQLPMADISVHAIDFPELKRIGDIPTGRFSKKIIEETETDLEIFIETLRELSVVVRRPDITDHSKIFSTPDWASDGLYNYCPRDIILAIGNKIIEAPSPLRSRLFESNAYKSIFLDYLHSGAQWISAPKPKLLAECYGEPHGYDVCLENTEPLFDAANILRVGEDILYLISNSGNELGALWLQNTLGSNYTVHKCYNLYNQKHIDTTFTFLRPGLVIVNPMRVNDDNLPKMLRSWDKIWFDDIVDVGSDTNHPLSSKWIGMNFLMVNKDLALVESRQTPLIKILEKHKIDVIPLQLRHPRAMGGGFHCVSCDVRRRGTLEKYT
ncbi:MULTISPECIES: inosamine-phosphate amidinotransferase 1 [unclassified Pseudomonas]|uniref:inosamine-phosphate amidinotransferase 1 n=1 Tax=unclassified Pseudomonas TaxID=196821 RepID=UPI000C86B6E3|nr:MULTISPECIES: inosamine-phosphate amidinotransferase 1 [unclassified Pseudomonas]PMV20230.1 inosamine-phosphate amidinotransferase 1 [Pseudomonas sp. FW305-3-2-15-C-TSA2]PMV24553.1 inosamine-phosphate amidinotransferase 1 [Pseudomonas sp. DP16D-L5]PMV36667.1 inosamine-phosphate amidinotransferase 1 [Pseudomonas sp. FW305-3-2-15-A-LB2]PMV42659.1 inosamine-phosphate amidinotransferase 1 [Pseudomonas sp. FW305-3-2-15-C-R2A1]PMV49285.1 inosamine-phosphate amidinotransferase 1 [Pseudomonas sp. F